MTLVHLRNLGLTLSGPLFSNLDLSVGPGDRIGVVAANGRGKTSLLRCIAGTLEPSEGEITRARGLTIGHVEQAVPSAIVDLAFYDAVLAALPREAAESESWRVDVVLSSLSVPDAYVRRPLRALSGGWQRLALVARAWIAEPDLLLLDEPTNHLDLGRIALLETWLNALPRDLPVVLSSHDRAFLDAVTNRTLFLRAERSPVFSLPYTNARLALDEADAAEARRHDRDMKTADQLRRQAAKLKNIGINSGSDLLVVKTRQLRERAERLEAAARPAHLERSAGAIRLESRPAQARVLLTLADAEVRTPDGTLLLRTGRRFLCQGDRVVLLGPNGAGKSRLVAMLRTAILTPQTAADGLRATPSLVLGYGDQALADLSDAETPLAAVTARFDLGEQAVRTLLAGAGIAIDRQLRPIGRLSGGQKARLGLLMLRLAKPNLYLLDEPTNHLDIEGQEALETELLAREASCLLVSHDRSFVRAVGNRFWTIERKTLVEVDGPEAFFTAAAS